MAFRFPLDSEILFFTEVDTRESFRVNRGYQKHITTRGGKGFHMVGSKNTTISLGLPVPQSFSESDGVSGS